MEPHALLTLQVIAAPRGQAAACGLAKPVPRPPCWDDTPHSLSATRDATVGLHHHLKITVLY
jgi:hypothetical protein